MRIAPYTSFILDALRLLAAAGVVFAHLDNSGLFPGAAALQAYGGCFVVTFFVLSGYVIAATTNPTRADGFRYFATRFARLWTVALPALLLAFLLQEIGGRVAPASFAEFDRGHAPLRYLLAATFSNEFWFVSAGPPMVLPVWSLAYEFWFYALFGIGVYIRTVRLRALAMLLTGVVAGPKILALLPIWLLGVAAWKSVQYRHVSERWAFTILGSSGSLLIGLVIAHPRWPGGIGFAPWFFSGAWFSDWLFGIGIAGLIVGFDARLHSCPVPPRLSAVVRRGAGVSFSLYLLHYPLMVFCAALLPYDRSNVVHVAGILALIFLLVYLFGSVFEPQRKTWAPRLEAMMRLLWPSSSSVAARVTSPRATVAVTSIVPGIPEKTRDSRQ